MILSALLELELTTAEEFLVALCVLEGATLTSLPLSSRLYGRLAEAFTRFEKLPAPWRFEICASIIRGGRRAAA